MMHSFTFYVATAIACMCFFTFYQLGMFLGNNIVIAAGGGGASDEEIMITSNSDDMVVVHAHHFIQKASDDKATRGSPFGNGVVPKCAKYVFVSLYKTDKDEQHDDGGGFGANNNEDYYCLGLILKDDIILTSNDCSKSNFTLDFPGIDGEVEAYPHAELNSKKKQQQQEEEEEEENDDILMIDQRLGFLKANTPPHYIFADQPIQRNRMFLSTKPDKTVVAKCQNLTKPVVHNFPLNDGTLVPLGHLERVLSDYDMLWEEDAILDNAYMLEDHKGDRWWTRRVSLREEEHRYLKPYFEEYEGKKILCFIFFTKANLLVDFFYITSHGLIFYTGVL